MREGVSTGAIVADGAGATPGASSSTSIGVGGMASDVGGTVADVVGADGCSTLSAGAVDEVGVGASSLVTAK